jgi:general secretion pathway protein K
MLLALLAGSYAFGVRTETRVMADLRGRAEARALAEAAMVFFGVMLADAQERELLPLNGTPLVREFFGRELTLRITDVSGLVDLNKASRALLKQAVVWAGVPSGEEDAVVDALLDWRDANSLRELNGAEDDDYIRAGFPAGAKDDAFESVEEVGQVLGIDPDVAKRMALVTTVHGSAGINPAAAPAEVLALLGGDDSALGPAPPDEDEYAVELPSSEHYGAGEGLGIFRIDVQVGGELGEMFRFAGVIEPSIADRAKVLAWRE